MIQNPRTETFQQTPIPTEIAYFLNDAAKFKYTEVENDKVVVKEKLIRDKNKFNRYYFNYPPEWKTSNVGEMIVGVRSLWAMNRPREFNFNIFLRKYKKKDFHEAMKKYDNDKYGDLTDKELYKAVLGMSDKTIQDIIDKHLDEKQMIVFPFNISVALRSKDNFLDIWNIINETLSVQTDLKHTTKDFVMNRNDLSIDDKLKYIQALNKYTDNTELLYQYNRDLWFNQDISNIHNLFGENKDVAMFETYNNNELVESLYSPCNHSSSDPYYVDMLFVHDINTYYKKYIDEESNDMPKDPDLPPFFAEGIYCGKSKDDPEPLTKDDEFNKDFNAIFNIGDDSSQISLDYITTYHRVIAFRNIYNRESLKIHASFGNPSNNYYIGNTHVYFDPIKYYKLKTKDDKFWIEFYSGRHADYPVNMPEDEGFVLEMLFMQNQKLLYT